jgi:hypothetical protein
MRLTRSIFVGYGSLILDIDLPSAVESAINRKIEQYYISEEYKFRVAREIRESERKKIEAEGISEFQRIVSKGISDSYLRWRGIEATLQLAQSSTSATGRTVCRSSWATSMHRHHRNLPPRLERKGLNQRRGQRPRLPQRH